MRIEETSFAWHETLGVPATTAADTARLAMRRLALRYHPDQGGTELQTTRINAAYAEGTTPSAKRQKHIRGPPPTTGALSAHYSRRI
jgi:curved DNA-binding protein CbpA